MLGEQHRLPCVWKLVLTANRYSTQILFVFDAAHSKYGSINEQRIGAIEIIQSSSFCAYQSLHGKTVVCPPIDFMSKIHCLNKSFRSFVRQMIKLLLIFGVIGLCVAQKSCPEDATGIYPLCKCKNFEFIFTNDACEKVNRDICPEPAFKTAFGCRCPDPKDFFDDYYWLCRTKLYLPTVRPTQRVVQDTCPVYTRGKWPDCERIPCAKHQTGDYEPYCVSHIQPIIVHEKKCPPGEFGTPPYCSVPCPQYRMRKSHLCHRR